MVNRGETCSAFVTTRIRSFHAKSLKRTSPEPPAYNAIAPNAVAFFSSTAAVAVGPKVESTLIGPGVPAGLPEAGPSWPIVMLTAFHSPAFRVGRGRPPLPTCVPRAGGGVACAAGAGASPRPPRPPPRPVPAASGADAPPRAGLAAGAAPPPRPGADSW